MTQDQVCDWLLGRNAREYRDNMRDASVRCFYLSRMTDAPDCGCNKRPPSLHIIVFPDIWLCNERGAHEGGVEFVVAGCAGDDRWLRATIYSCRRDEVADFLTDAEYTAKRLWTAFANTMNAMRPQEPTDDQI